MKALGILLLLALPMVAQFGTAQRVKRGVGAPAAGDCASVGDVGKVYARTDTQASNGTLYVCAQTGVGTFSWELGGSSGISDPGGNGLLARTALNTTVARTLSLGTRGGLTVTNGNGVAGNPTVDTDNAAVTLFSTSTGLPSALSDYATAGAGERLHIKTDSGTGYLSFGSSTWKELVFADTLTTKGDLYCRTSTGLTRLAVGATAGHVLTVDSAEACGVKWAAASGGGTSYTAPPTSGWSWQNSHANISVESTSTYQKITQTGTTHTQRAFRMRDAPAGDFTLTVVMLCDMPTSWSSCEVAADRGDATDTNARRTAFYMVTSGLEGGQSNASAFGVRGATYKTGASDTVISNTERAFPTNDMGPHWIRLTRSGSTLTWFYSKDGVYWHQIASDTETNWAGGAITRIGFGGYRNSVTAGLDSHQILVHWAVQ